MDTPPTRAAASTIAKILVLMCVFRPKGMLPEKRILPRLFKKRNNAGPADEGGRGA